jgi:long-chain fatty acid transport protein
MGKFCLCLLLIVLVLSAANVYAITDEEISRIIPFSFVNPGARSTAMGGAFIGLADDATAAEANPAGLIILTKPEVSVEYRNTQFEQSALTSIQGLTSPALDVISGSTSQLDDLNQVSWASFVYPLGDKFTLGFSRQEQLQQKGSIGELIVFDVKEGGPFELDVSATGNVDLNVVNWNFSGAAKLTQQFSLGATLRYSQLDWKANTDNVLLLILGGSAAAATSNTVIDDKDSAFAFNIGGLFRANSHVSFGGVYKRNAKFEVTENQTGELGVRSFTNELKIPDVYGAGIAIKPNDNMTISSDVVQIQYSQLADGIIGGINVLTLGNGDNINYEVKNGTEFHVGTEFIVFLGSVPVALRAGYYHKPIRSLIVESTQNLQPIDNQILDLVFNEKDPENHFTLGNGFVFGPHFQVDWALDVANDVDTFVLSSVVRF